MKAVERLVRFNKNEAGKYLYVMLPELYTPLAQQKVIREAALRSGVSQGVMQACWDAAGEVIKAWATEGHSVELKDELAKTGVQITCIDRNGEEVKRVTSTDDGNVEDPENESTNSGNNGSTENGGSQNQGGQNGGNSGGGTGTVTPSGGDGNGGNSGGGNTGGDNGGGNSETGGQD